MFLVHRRLTSFGGLKIHDKMRQERLNISNNIKSVQDRIKKNKTDSEIFTLNNNNHKWMLLLKADVAGYFNLAKPFTISALMKILLVLELLYLDRYEARLQHVNTCKHL